MSNQHHARGLRVAALAAALAFTTPFAAQAVPEQPLQRDAMEDALADLYIVTLRDAALASFEGDASKAAIPRSAKGKPDLESAQAKAYLTYLSKKQSEFLDVASKAAGRSVAPVGPQFVFQHALNGMVLRLSEDEAKRIGALPEVAAVEPSTLQYLDTDKGPIQVSATDIWSGTASGVRTRGEGVVIGVIDSGGNLGSPSFSDVAAADEISPGVPYDHTNPRGPGRFLGLCDPATPGHNPARDLCNDKRIGGHDFMDPLLPVQQFRNGRLNPNRGVDSPGFEDENDHGSHTSSIAAGNRRTVNFNGAPLTISGVAPRANVIVYDTCYTRFDGVGPCPTAATVAAANQAVRDGVVDVINMSIGGGTAPWTDAQSQAFLGAHNAGIYVATSAGNAGPGASTAGHLQPWVTNTASVTTDRLGFGFFAGVAGGTGELASFQTSQMTNGAASSIVTQTISARAVVSPNFDVIVAGAPNDACDPYSSPIFQGAIAILRRGGCTFAVKSENARAAGAIAALIANSGLTGQTGFYTNVSIAGPPQGRIPTLGFAFTTAQALRPFLAANPNAALTVRFPPEGVATRADVLAASSSRGPTTFQIMKPDLAAPGVQIVAAFSRTDANGVVVAGADTRAGLLSGTSMASPHNAGSAALLTALRPTWTPMEIKSALMSTANPTAVLKEDGSTASNPFDRGAGRINVAAAAQAGLVFNDTGANMQAQNPAAGGRPETINLASMQNGTCLGTCSFTRTARSVRSGPTTYTVAVNGLPSGAGTVSPASFTIAPNETQQITLNINANALPFLSYAFGEVVLTPNAGGVPVQRLPVAVRRTIPDIALSTTRIQARVLTGQTGTQTLTISNAGGPGLTWSLSTAAQSGVAFYNQDLGSGSGFASSFYNQNTPTPRGTYVADDFEVLVRTPLRGLRASGFVLPGGEVLTDNTLATRITVSIYADGNGRPAGAPESFGAAPLWTYSANVPAAGAAAVPGVTLTNNNIFLNLTAANNTIPALTLDPGRYWLVAFASVVGDGDLNGKDNPSWFWRTSLAPAAGTGNATAVAITPSAAGAAWAPLTSGNQPVVGLSHLLFGDFGCGVPWLTASATSGTLAAGENTAVTLNINPTGLAPGNYGGYLCVSTGSSDPDEALTIVPVSLTVDVPPVPLSASGTVDPGEVSWARPILMRVQVTPATQPNSTGIRVIANLRAIGGEAAAPLFDDATFGDITARDNTYSRTALIKTRQVPFGPIEIPVVVSDEQGRRINTSLRFSVVPKLAKSEDDTR
jgi:hypothetical protein